MAGLATAYGSGAMTNSINELLGTDLIFLIGSNTSEAHPVTGYRIKQAVKDGTKLIVADPRKIQMVDYADLWLRMRPGSNVALLNGLAHIIIRDNLWDKDFVKERTEGFEEWRLSLKEYTPERVHLLTGIEPELLEEAAHLLGKAAKATFVYAMGITQYTSGTNNVFGIANLAMLTGNVGSENTGVAPLRGQNNVQGACDMGGLPNYYPSYQLVSDSKARSRFEKAWGVPLSPREGYTVTEMFEAAWHGKVRGMYIMGENPVLSDPDANHVEEALNRLDFLIVQDIFLTKTAEYADLVLPAATFAEKEGTFTNTERRVQRVRKAVESPGECRSDWEIIRDLANRMGHAWNYENSRDIMEEINDVAPHYGGITYERLEEEGLQWPCPNREHPGTKFLHEKRFARGKGAFHVVNYLPPDELPDEEYPLVLITGRMLYHFHTGSMSRRSRLEEIHSRELMMVHPRDAEMYGITDESLVRVISRRGQVATNVQITDEVPPGSVFMTFHFEETPTNQLTNSATDPVCKIPELKQCAVRLETVKF